MRIPIFPTLYRAGLAWNRDNASYLGAALAYYALFSIAPMLIIAIAIVGVVYGREAVEHRMVGQLQDYIGADAAKAIEDMVQNAWNQETSVWTTVIGSGLLLFAAANLFLQLRIALDMLWGLPPLPHRNVFVATLMRYLLAFLMVLVAAGFWLALMAGDTALTLFIKAVGDSLPGGEFHWKIGQFCLLFVLMTVFFVLTFFSIGLLSNFKKLWQEGIARLAAVYLVSLFGFVIWVGLLISWLFFGGIHPPLAS
jgi:membrane protein